MQSRRTGREKQIDRAISTSHTFAVRGSSLAVSMAAAAKAVDLTGAWVLQKTEGIDDFLISMEQPWLKRKAAQAMLVRPPPEAAPSCPLAQPSRCCAEPSLGWPQHTQSVTYVYQMAEEDGVPVLKTRTQRGGGEWEERDCKLDGVRREDVDRKGKPGWVREPPASLLQLAAHPT